MWGMWLGGLWYVYFDLFLFFSVLFCLVSRFAVYMCGGMLWKVGEKWAEANGFMVCID